MTRLLAAIALAAVPLAAPAGYWDASDAGWYWYEEPPPEEAASEEEPEPEGPVETEGQRPELAAHAALQRRLEETRIVAIMDPTPANVETYLRVQREVMDRSARFADVWQRVVWVTPDLDYQFTHRPTNAAALHTWESRRRSDHGGLVAEAAKEHGLFFLFGEDCLHCAQMGQVLRRFAAGSGFTVQAVATGGAAHAAFPEAWPDNGFAAALGIDSFPALVLARLTPGDEAAFPVAYGPLSEGELEERIAVMTGVPVGERF